MAASIEVFDEGDKIIVRATWKTESVAGSENYNTVTDPTTVVFTARRRLPDGTLAAATTHTYPAADVVKISVGVYEFSHIPTPGKWFVHAQGTGTAHGAGRVEYEIDASEALAA